MDEQVTITSTEDFIPAQMDTSGCMKVSPKQLGALEDNIVNRLIYIMYGDPYFERVEYE